MCRCGWHCWKERCAGAGGSPLAISLDRSMRWFPWLLLLLIAVVGWLPGDVISQLEPIGSLPAGGDKVLHAVGFLLLALSFRGWRGLSAPTSRWLPGAVAILVLFALIHESLQQLVPGRSRDGADLVADLVGATGGIVIGLILFPGGRSSDSR